jgi:hypothetical protein
MELRNGKYMNIRELPLDKGRKTHIYSLHEIGNEDYELGQIAWYGPWRKFCFFTNGGMVFDKGCMQQIIVWVDILNEDHKNKKKEENAI